MGRPRKSAAKVQPIDETPENDSAKYGAIVDGSERDADIVEGAVHGDEYEGVQIIRHIKARHNTTVTGRVRDIGKECRVKGVKYARTYAFTKKELASLTENTLRSRLNTATKFYEEYPGKVDALKQKMEHFTDHTKAGAAIRKQKRKLDTYKRYYDKYAPLLEEELTSRHPKNRHVKTFYNQNKIATAILKITTEIDKAVDRAIPQDVDEWGQLVRKEKARRWDENKEHVFVTSPIHIQKESDTLKRRDMRINSLVPMLDDLFRLDRHLRFNFPFHDSIKEISYADGRIYTISDRMPIADPDGEKQMTRVCYQTYLEIEHSRPFTDSMLPDRKVLYKRGDTKPMFTMRDTDVQHTPLFSDVLNLVCNNIANLTPTAVNKWWLPIDITNLEKYELTEGQKRALRNPKVRSRSL